jgi:hypothetical protein
MATSQKTPYNTKTKLMAEDIIKIDRKNRAEFIAEMPGDGSSVFRKVLGSEDGIPPNDANVDK